MILFRIAPGGCCERVWVCRVPEASRLHVPGVWSLSLQLHCWERRWDRHPLWEHQPRQHGCRLEGRVQKKIFQCKNVTWGGESKLVIFHFFELFPKTGGWCEDRQPHHRQLQHGEAVRWHLPDKWDRQDDNWGYTNQVSRKTLISILNDQIELICQRYKERHFLSNRELLGGASSS